jgi:hypothetical protein
VNERKKKKRKNHKCDLVTILFQSLLGNGKSLQSLKLPNIKKGEKPSMLEAFNKVMQKNAKRINDGCTPVHNNLLCIKVLMTILP